MSSKDARGVLRWNPETERLAVEDESGRKYKITKPERALDPDLLTRPYPELDGTVVEYVRHKTDLRHIRPVGVARAPRTPQQKTSPDDFHNPYTFVPAPPRDGYVGEFADSPGPGHHRLHPDRWSGRIGVRLTVVTPLLLLDTARAWVDPDTRHETYPVLRRDGSPHLSATAVKGMLRAAYEAVTNSRMSVFTGHRERLGMRMASTDAQRMVPARISDDGREVVLLPGDTPPGGQKEHNPVLHAAWLPRYGVQNPTAPSGYSAQHSDKVDAEVELIQHHRWDRRKQRHVPDFRMWRVMAIARAGEAVPAAAAPAPQPPQDGRSWYEPRGTTKQITGWVMITERNFSKKHDERVFFTDQESPRTEPLTQNLQQQWEDVVNSYVAAHRPTDIQGRRHNGRAVGPAEWIGKDPGRTAWSPHLHDSERADLRPGQLCYAEVGQRGKVIGLYPVMIGRRLHDTAPWELLPRSVRPATEPDKLSPADRVFGWAHDEGSGAYRGHLRVGPVFCVDAQAAVESDPTQFGADGLPLAILGQPKPQQARFYAADSAAAPHQPLAKSTPREEGYSRGRGLRGRKIYPHHAGVPDGYWDNPVEDRTQKLRDGHYQEYRRPHEGYEDGRLTPDRASFKITDREQRDDQNRSIRGWVRPGAAFEFTVDVTNLGDIEFGALLWLLQLPADHHHRLGYGKPLGFGSVQLDLVPDRTSVCRGHEWVKYYCDLSTSDGPAGEDPAVLSALGNRFVEAMPDRDLVVAAFQAAAIGDPTVAVHYPRTRPEGMDKSVPVPPDPRGRSFTWFVENERVTGGQVAHGDPLPRAGERPLTVHQDGFRRSRS